MYFYLSESIPVKLFLIICYLGVLVCAPISLYILLNEESRIMSSLYSEFLMEPKSFEDYLKSG